MLKDIILRCINERQSFYVDPDIPPPKKGKVENRVPTLKPGVFRDTSPMLFSRFLTISRWEHATHGHWLDVNDMESMWSAPNSDLLLNEVWQQHIIAKEEWPNIASSLFLPERLSLFAGSDIGNEKAYLLWLDFIEEPEIWVYDANGESRYKDLREYLNAYINDDISACGKSWRA